MDNNADGKNTCVKADFNIYNITGTDVDVSTDYISDVDDTSGADNTSDTDNPTEKVSSNINTSTNIDADADDISCMDNMIEKVSNNTNIGASKLSGVNQANKGELNRVAKSALGGTNKGEMSGSNIKAGVDVDASNKDRLCEIDMSRVGEVDIEANKKPVAKASASIDNSTDSDGDSQVTDQRAYFESVAIAALAAINNLPSGAAIFNFDQFFVAFAALANTTLEKEANVYESIPAGFISR